MITNYLNLLLSHRDLSSQQTEEVIEHVFDSGVDPCQTAAFLTLLKFKGETVEELLGMIQSLVKKALPVNFTCPVLDIVGTGGDRSNSVNISTGAAILAAACGIPVAKHGNRSVSSQCGSADVLEALGIQIDMAPKTIVQCLHENRIAFMYAPSYHPCLAKIREVRRGLKIPTAINLIAPLLNPAKAEFSVIGASDLDSVEKISQIICRLDHIKRAFVFNGCGLDELTPIGTIVGYEIIYKQKKRIKIDPAELGFSPCALEDLQGGSIDLNARLLKEALSGKEGPIADSLIFTAGVSLWIYGHSESILEGIHFAKQTLKQGNSLQVLENWKDFSSQLKEGS